VGHQKPREDVLSYCLLDNVSWTRQLASPLTTVAKERSWPMTVEVQRRLLHLNVNWWRVTFIPRSQWPVTSKSSPDPINWCRVSWSTRQSDSLGHVRAVACWHRRLSDLKTFFQAYIFVNIFFIFLNFGNFVKLIFFPKFHRLFF